ncbi:MAG: succinate-semialdehyde dehydrogenase/glutarate-semialdehyde dehydrogenase, partial [Nonlabens sp.]
MESNITTVNPATGKEIKSYDLMTEKEALEAVEKCHTAFTN